MVWQEIHRLQAFKNIAFFCGISLSSSEKSGPLGCLGAAVSEAFDS